MYGIQSPIWHLFDDCPEYRQGPAHELVVYVSAIPNHDPTCSFCIEKALREDED